MTALAEVVQDSCVLAQSLVTAARRYVVNECQSCRTTLTVYLSRLVGVDQELSTVAKDVKQDSVSAVSMFLKAAAQPRLLLLQPQLAFRPMQPVVAQVA